MKRGCCVEWVGNPAREQMFPVPEERGDSRLTRSRNKQIRLIYDYCLFIETIHPCRTRVTLVAGAGIECAKETTRELCEIVKCVQK